MKDIETRSDIELLIREFYGKLLSHPGMKDVFKGIDFESHIPRIVHFWSFVLLDESGYTTNVFDKHLHLPIQLPQFDIWLEKFITSVDALYKGEKAEMAKQRATVLTFTFKNKWQHLKS